MKYGDFASLVQLGVGLHVGTALLQLYGELGVAPLARALSRTRGLFAAPENERPPKEIEEELERLESRYEIFKVRLFKEYRKYVFFNLLAAALLAIILTIIAFKADDAITPAWEWTTCRCSRCCPVRSASPYCGSTRIVRSNRCARRRMSSRSGRRGQLFGEAPRVSPRG
jgi:hypothetical protein